MTKDEAKAKILSFRSDWITNEQRELIAGWLKIADINVVDIKYDISNDNYYLTLPTPQGYEA